MEEQDVIMVSADVEPSSTANLLSYLELGIGSSSPSQQNGVEFHGVDASLPSPGAESVSTGAASSDDSESDTMMKVPRRMNESMRTVPSPDNYTVDITSLAKASGQRPPTPRQKGQDESNSGKPKKKKKVASEYYDLFAVDDRKFFIQTRWQGFYVSSGEVALMKDRYGTKESPIALDDDDDVPDAYFPRASENGISRDRKKNLHAESVFHGIKDNKGSPCQQQLDLEVVVMCRGVRQWIYDIKSVDTTPKNKDKPIHYTKMIITFSKSDYRGIGLCTIPV
ncbi:hypothetical protein F5050DRAFT_1786360 [Lentinula boryana]|uniref:Uncharacterized protein n=1 Tax=Lentinula boryana TaxID=40481 RepID=A0ABQ8Q2K4_9AGAR|nr:hypothetical protein F5050DRAFT_1786360 [Lentinula boryana]